MSLSDPTSNPPPVALRSDRWVVGFDGSAEADAAVSWATRHAVGRASVLETVTVWESPLTTTARSSTGPIVEANSVVRAAAESTATHAAEIARRQLGPDSGVAVASTCVHGSTASMLLDIADTASLLVVGNRGQGGFARLLLGSTSHQCATHATAPTAVIREPETLPDGSATQRIVVGVDGSNSSIAALKWAIDFASPSSIVVVVWVWDVSPLAVGADQFFFPEASDLARSSLTELIEFHRAGAADRDITLQHEFVDGSPRSSLLEAGSSADLIVVGARGHGPIGAALLGSVSSWLVHHADRPVVVVPAD